MKTKICFFIDNYSFLGSEVIVDTILRFIVHEGQSPCLIYRFNPRLASQIDELSNKWKVNVQLIPVNIFTFEDLINHSRLSSSHFLFNIFRLAQKILVGTGAFYLLNFINVYRALCLASPTFVYINSGGLPGSQTLLLAAYIASKYLNIVTLAQFHNFSRKCYGILNHSRIRFFLKDVRYISSGSFASLGQIAYFLHRQNNAVFSSKYVCLRNALPAVIATPTSKNNFPPLKLVSAGHLETRKGHRVLIQALSQIPPDIEWHLDIFGEGPLLNSLLMLINDLDLKSQISLKGFARNLNTIFPNYDLLIHPSLFSEDLPLVILMSMRCGLPVIASDVGGISEAVNDSSTGFLVSANSVSQIRDKILHYYKLPSRSKFQMRESCISEFQEKFSISTLQDNFNRLLQSV